MVAAAPPLQRPSLASLPDDDLPKPPAAVTEAPDEMEMPLPSDPRTFFLGGLFGLGALAALYVASAIILPVVLAFVLNLLLQPAVRLLGRLHLPRTVGALLTVFLVIGALAGLVAALSVPTATWAERLPEGIPRLEAHLQVIRGPIEALQKVIQGRAGYRRSTRSGLDRLGSPRSWPDGRTFRRDALRTRWPVYDCPGALLSFGSGRHIPSTHC